MSRKLNFSVESKIGKAVTLMCFMWLVSFAAYYFITDEEVLPYGVVITFLVLRELVDVIEIFAGKRLR